MQNSRIYRYSKAKNEMDSKNSFMPFLKTQNSKYTVKRKLFGVLSSLNTNVL